jgi:hypothetical protein
MEREEREAEEAKKLAQENTPKPEEPQTPELSDNEWMELELNRLKHTHGDDFGDDLNLQF